MLYKKKPYLPCLNTSSHVEMSNDYFRFYVNALFCGLDLGSSSFFSSRLWYPSIYSFLRGHRDKRAKILYSKTLEQLNKALLLGAFIREQGGSIYVVLDKEHLKKNNNKNFTKNLFLQEEKNKIKPLGWSHDKWTGGTFSNFQEVYRTISLYGSVSRQFFQFLQQNKNISSRHKSFSKFRGSIYTRDFKTSIEGVYKDSPDLIIVENAQKNRNVICEAYALGIPVIAFVDSNSAVLDISISIPVNVQL